MKLLTYSPLKCLDKLYSFPLGQCTFDGTPLNGKTLNKVLVKGATLKHNSIVEYSCDSSYKLTGSKVLHCRDGQWNATTPSCKGIMCFTINTKNKRMLHFFNYRNQFNCLVVYFIFIFHYIWSSIKANFIWHNFCPFIVLDNKTAISKYNRMENAIPEYMIV